MSAFWFGVASVLVPFFVGMAILYGVIWLLHRFGVFNTDEE